MIAAGPARLAGPSGLSYFRVMLNSARHGPLPPSAERRPTGVAAFAIIVAGAVVAVATLLAAAVLWIRYGTAVFFEMIATGLAACF